MKNFRSLLCLAAFATLLALPSAQAQTLAPAQTLTPPTDHPAATALPTAPTQPAQPAQPAQQAAPKQAPAKTAPAPAPATPALPLTPLANQLNQTLQTLVGTSAAAPAPAAAPATPAPTDSVEDNAGQIADTFATGMLDTIAKTVDSLKANSTLIPTLITAGPDFFDWLARQSDDPRRAVLWSDISKDLLIVVGAPLIAAVAFLLLMAPVRIKIKRNRPRTLPGQIGLLGSLFVLRLLPAVVFLAASLLLLDQNEAHRLPRLVILNVIYAVALGYVVQQILRCIISPTAAHLRPVSLATPQAVSCYRWFSGFSFVIIYSYFLIDVAAVLRVPPTAITVFQNLFALILTIMAISVIVKTRASVAAILRGKSDEDEEERQQIGYALRQWLALHWHNLAILYLVVSIGATLLGINNGFALILRGTLLSIAILTAARFTFLLVERWRLPDPNVPALTHRQFISFLLRPGIWIASGVLLALTWGVRIDRFTATAAGQRAVGAVISTALTLAVLTILYEMLHNAIERHLNRRDKITKQPVASARARTLLPMVRNSVFILFSIIAVLSCLATIGINIAPLLAGAGVLGVAIGFGSQTLVKDFLTGLFIVVENTIAVGDVVKIDSFTGTVEALSIRTIRLRDVDGSLHILPFSEVSKLTNMSKGFAYALVDVGIAYNSDLEKVINVLHTIGAELQEDAVFKRVILEPIEVMGVESLGDFSITVRARMRTRPGKQWEVRRFLLLRIKQRFDREGIDIPFPTTLHLNKTMD